MYNLTTQWPYNKSGLYNRINFKALPNLSSFFTKARRKSQDGFEIIIEIPYYFPGLKSKIIECSKQGPN